MNPSGNLSVVDEVLLNATGHVCSSGNMKEHELIYQIPPLQEQSFFFKWNVLLFLLKKQID